jgi:multicomponent Na+:H+ antiporter subunit D
VTSHPGLVLILAAALLAVTRGSLRSAIALAAPLAALALAWGMPEGRLLQIQWLGLEIVPMAVDKLSRLFALIFSLMAFAGALFALSQERRLELPAAFLYAGAAIGVALAGDLVTVFMFWETMAIGSTLVLWSAATPASYRASMRYVMVHLFGGMLLFVGAAGHVMATGSTAFTSMEGSTVYQNLILAAFLVNAAAWPLSAWLPDTREPVLGREDNRDGRPEAYVVRSMGTSNGRRLAPLPVPDRERPPSASCQHPVQRLVLGTRDLSSHPS